MKVSFEGIGEQIVTFLNNQTNGASAGDMVCLSGNGEVKAAAADAMFAGVCVGGDEEYAAVQLQGVVTRGYTGTTAPTVGYVKLTAAAGGKVSVGDTGREYLVLAVDTTAKNVTFVL